MRIGTNAFMLGCQDLFRARTSVVLVMGLPRPGEGFSTRGYKAGTRKMQKGEGPDLQTGKDAA